VLSDPTGDDAALVVADTVLVDVKRAVLRTRQPGYSPEAYSDEYGTWMSGYVPLSNGGEDLPVLLAVDLPLGALPVMTDIVWGALLRSLVPALVLSLIVAVLLSRRLTRPVTNLTDAMARVRGGDYTASVAITSSDEIGEMSQAFNELVVELEEKARLRSILDRSVSTVVADKLLTEGLTLTGEMREITALFADIRGFTSLVESLPAKAVVKMLNEYFGALIPCVQRHGGVVDKLIGDEVFAVFGAPVDLEDDAISAVRAAVDMREALAVVNWARVARGDPPPITFGVGMNSGSAVAGGLGADTHLEYTVVGNVVNIAARLCSEAEAGQIIMSQATYVRVKQKVDTRALEPVSVKGVTFPLDVFDLISVNGS
jgi:class 3 adenylate cyclase